MLIDYKKLLNLAIKSFPVLKGKTIILKEDENFSCEVINNNYFIITYSKLKEDYFKKNICSYIKNKFNLKDSLIMFNQWEEIFSFFHEVGHIINYGKIENETIYYSNYKNTTYRSYREAFTKYRSIPTEELSDKISLEIIKNNLVYLYIMFNNQTLEGAREEINFWNTI